MVVVLANIRPSVEMRVGACAVIRWMDLDPTPSTDSISSRVKYKRDGIHVISTSPGPTSTNPSDTSFYSTI